MRWFLLTYNMKNSKYYFYNGVAGLVVFFACRVAVIPPFWYMMHQLNQTEFWAQIPFYYKFICIGGSIPLDSLNCYWFYRIILISIKVLKGPKAPKETAAAPASKSKVSTD
jgi:hypothetical protein